MNNNIVNNRYKILEEIGSGGMAIIYKAHDIRLNRIVAIKVLRENFVDNQEFIRRFEKEAQSAARLSHINIISIYDVDFTNNLNYIIMEYVDGVSLREFIDDQTKISWAESLNILIQTSKALENAHKNNIIHRDIKPDNILINEEGVVKVSDFGIAKVTSASTELTRKGVVMGSLYYMSPEQAKGDKIDKRTDIYSLGITFYEMLTGEPPFLGTNIMDVANKHISTNVVPPIEKIKDLPPIINDIILKTLKKDPNERYTNVHELLIDLNKALKASNLFNKTMLLHNKIYDTFEKKNQEIPNSKNSLVRQSLDKNVDNSNALHKQNRTIEETVINSKKLYNSENKSSKFSKKLVYSLIIFCILIISSLIVIKFTSISSIVTNYNSSNSHLETKSNTTAAPQDSPTKEKIKDSSKLIENGLKNYYESLINSINKNDFSQVEPNIVKNSNLYNGQKKLIISLNKQNIKEKLISYNVKSISDLGNLKYKIYVEETIAIKKPPSTNYINYTYKYIYWAEENNNIIQFSDIQKWNN